MIDFGLAKKFTFDESGEHIKLTKNAKFAGSVRYCSIMTAVGMSAGRRDDMESLCYTLVDIGTGGLPWKTGKG